MKILNVKLSNLSTARQPQHPTSTFNTGVSCISRKQSYFGPLALWHLFAASIHRNTGHSVYLCIILLCRTLQYNYQFCYVNILCPLKPSGISALRIWCYGMDMVVCMCATGRAAVHTSNRVCSITPSDPWGGGGVLLGSCLQQLDNHLPLGIFLGKR